MRSLALLTLFVLFPFEAIAEEVKIAVGLTRNEVIATMKKHGARDITPGMAVESPDRKTPPTELYWEFRDYDIILELGAKKGKNAKAESLSIWTKKDFGHSILRRVKTEQKIKVLKLNTETKEATFEKLKQENGQAKE